MNRHRRTCRRTDHRRRPRITMYDAHGRTDRAVGQIQAATRRHETKALDAGEVAVLVNAAQTILDAHARAITEADQQRTRAEAAEAEREQLADALRDLDRHITDVVRSELDK